MPRLGLALFATMAGGCGPDPAPAVADAGPDRTVYIGEEVTFDAGASRGVSFTWYIDGERRGDGPDLTLSWSEPGRRDVVLQVTGEDGLDRTDGATVYVVREPAAVAPSWSSKLAVLGDRVWVVWPEANQILGFRGPDDVWVRAPCRGPSTLAAAEDGLFVACADDDRVVRTDLAGEGVQSWAFPAGSRPAGVAWDQGSGGFVVTLAGLGVVERVVGEVRQATPAADPRGVVVLPDGAWIATSMRGTSLWDSDGLALELSWVRVPDSDTDTGGTPNLIEQIVVAPDGQTAWLPGLLANVERGTWCSGRDLTFETTVRASLHTLAVGGGGALVEEPDGLKIFDDQGRALAAVPSPKGELVWVAFPGTGVVLAVDTFDGSIRRSILGAGDGVVGLGVSPEGETLYTWAWLDRTLSAWDVTVDPPTRRWSHTAPGEVLDPPVLTGLRLFWEAGDRRMARSGYIACAHCHPDGDHDGLTWDFTGRGEGLRNTTTLWGRAGTAMGPLHWTGNFDEVHDFEGDIRAAQRGTGLLDDADFMATQDPLGPPKAGLSDDLDALAAYLETLDETPRAPSTFVVPDGASSLFLARCVGCHPPPLYTDSRLDNPVRHDVGTLGPSSGGRLGGPLDGLDTPTLLGVWATAPYLHDGSAGTLREAISRHVPGLTDAEIQALELYVRAL